jgi:dipeptidase E
VRPSVFARRVALPVATVGALVAEIRLTALPKRHIIAIGGWTRDDPAQSRALVDYVLRFARGRRICYVPTTAADDARSIVAFYEVWRGRGELSHVEFFPWPPENLRDVILRQDVLVVSGGNTANMLAIWRVHGFERLLREAWEGGTVLTGWSAGMICWFEASVTDSFGPQLRPLSDGLGLLAGSACPHYDSADLRRPTYIQAVAEGLPPGIAADDGVALRYAGTELAEVVTVRPGARAYRVEPGKETLLEPIPLAERGPAG